MTTALVALENQLKPLAPRLEMVLDKRVPVQRLMQTILISCERLPKLYECDRQSLFNAAMSAAVLGLEVDGVTGQAYLIPFKGRAQLVVGYKGYNTLAARSGITITGEVVREGDDFDFDEGEGWVRHKKSLSGEPNRRIIAAWAKAAANGRPSVVKVLPIAELMAVKAKSPAVKNGADTPWNDPSVGFPAMCEKTAKRRLSRSLPLNLMQLAARLDEAVDEQGIPAFISDTHGVVLDGKAEPSETPTAQQLLSPRPDKPAVEQAAPSEHGSVDGAADVSSAADYVSKWTVIVDRASRKEHGAQIAAQWNKEKPLRDLIEWPDDDTFAKLKAKVTGAIEVLKTA